MTVRRGRLGAVASVCVASLLACGRGHVDAPPPDSLAITPEDTLPALPPSQLDAPIEFDLAPMIDALEQAVPRQFGDLRQRRQVGNNRRMRAAFVAYRSPFEISFSGMTVLLSAVVEYEGKGWYKPPLAPELSGSCGVGANSRPRAAVEIASTLRLTPDWRLRSTTELRKLEPLSDDRRDHCQVTIFNVDVTERVMRAANVAIGQRLGVLDSRLATVDVRSRIERWWSLMQRPIRLADSLWLQLNPTSVRLGAVQVDGRQLQAQVGLTGLPRILSGSRPPEHDVPLPRLQDSAQVGGGMHMLLEATLGYDVASAILRKQLVGKRIRRGTHRIQVRDVSLRGIGGGRVALSVEFEGWSSGRVWFVGTPKYDEVTDELFVPDLDYDVRSADLLVHGLSWMKRGNIRDYLQQHARWPVGDLMEKARERLERGMNRPLGRNAELSATVTAGKAIDVRALPWALMLRARAEGAAKLVVIKTPELGKR